jgi:hypothetical protein
MKRKLLTGVWLALLLIFPVTAPSQAVDMAVLFPEIEGWQKDGNPGEFQAENLYEYIDGAAENFLAYGFRQLVVQNYVNSQKHALCAEIYFHGTPENAFGIYGSEKPVAGNYFIIGSQGYSEEGVLNFISDAYYVKLNGFDFGSGGKKILEDLARKIVVAINGKNGLPETVNAFPAQGRIAHSERFIADHFLGHDFLPAAFTSDYQIQGQKFQLFIIKAADENNARVLLQRYAALDKGKPAPAIQPGILTIQDPYNGPIQLFWRGNYIWGIKGQIPAAKGAFDALTRNMEKH